LGKHAEERLVTILESIPDGFPGLDRDWRLVYVNASTERMIGRSRNELLGRIFGRRRPAAKCSRRIGLAIVRKAVERMGGQVRCRVRGGSGKQILAAITGRSRALKHFSILQVEDEANDVLLMQLAFREGGMPTCDRSRFSRTKEHA
jgi:PAS domain-containing protein